MRKRNVTHKDLMAKLKKIEIKVDKKFRKTELKIDGSTIWAYFALAVAGGFACFSFAYILKKVEILYLAYVCSIFAVIFIIMIFHNFWKQYKFDKE